MRVLVFHNQYNQAGGEDTAVDEESRMLRQHGVDVLVDKTLNPPVQPFPLYKQLDTAYNATWSRESYRRVFELCIGYRPDVAHVHNFWLALSPSVHKACHDAGVPTVQTLHNYRLLCLNALMLREGRTCQDCLNKVPWRGVLRRCYRGSIGASAAVAGMVTFHRIRNTWFRDVDAFVTPSNYARSRLVLGKVPADRITVKPNVVADRIQSTMRPSLFHTVVYVGRLSTEKGLQVLLSAWAKAVPRPTERLLIVGDGPDSAGLRSFAEISGLHPPSVVFAGSKPHDEVRTLVSQSRFLVLPSLCAETFGYAVVEAFGEGRPAVVSDCGALADIVENGRTGYKVRPADASQLAKCISTLLNNDTLVDQLGEEARAKYLLDYSTEQNYRVLIEIYRSAMKRYNRVVTSESGISAVIPECVRQV